MELSNFSSLLFPFLIFILSAFLILIKKRRNPNLTVPPGPWKLPIVGNIHHLVGDSLPHRRLRDLANKHGPLMHLQLGQVHHVVISSPEIAKQALKTHDLNFAYRPPILALKTISYNFKDIAMAPYGEHWRQMRKICTLELLSAKRVQSFRSIREEEVSGLVKRISNSAQQGCSVHVNLSKMLCSLTYSIIARAAFGKIPREQEDSFRRILHSINDEALGLSVADLFPSFTFLQVISGHNTKVERLHQESDKFLENIIGQHKQRKTLGKSGVHADLVDVLLNFQDEDKSGLSLLEAESMKAVILDLFSGGTETSSTLLEWAMSEMIKNPEVMQKAQAEVRQVFGIQGSVDEARIDELNYMKLVIQETLRLHPPLPLLFPKQCAEACEINGHHIPARTRVLVNAWALGRDPSSWTEAERFYPERFLDSKIDYKGSNFKFIPFGAGRRICPGIGFGMASVELPLANLLYHFDWKLPGGTNAAESLDMDEAFGVSVRRKNALELIPVLYHPPSAAA